MTAFDKIKAGLEGAIAGAGTVHVFYPASFERLDGEVVVRFRDLPEVLTGAATIERARELAADALKVVLLSYVAAGRALPPASAPQDGEEPVSATVPAQRSQIGLEVEAGLREAIAHAKANKR